MGEETESGLWDRGICSVARVPEPRPLVKRVECAGPSTSASGTSKISEQPVPTHPTTCWASRVSLGVAREISGSLSCKADFLSCKILNSTWSNHLLPIPSSSETLQGLRGEERERVPGITSRIQGNSAFASYRWGFCLKAQQNLPLISY